MFARRVLFVGTEQKKSFGQMPISRRIPCPSNQMRANTYGKRFFSSKEKRKNDLVDKNFAFIFPEPTDNYIKWTEMQILNPQTTDDLQQQVKVTPSFSISEPSTKINHDESTIVHMKAPRGHIEDMEEGRKHGFNRYYKRTVSGLVVGIHKEASTIGVRFHPNPISTEESNAPKTTLSQFLDNQRIKFFQEEPSGLVTSVHLSPTITSNLDKNNLPFQVLIFNDGMDTITRVFHHTLQLKTNIPRMSLFVQTPNGFWEFANYSSSSNLLNSKFQKETFADMVKNIKIQLVGTDSSKDASTMISATNMSPEESHVVGATSIGSSITLRTASEVVSSLSSSSLAKKKPIWELKKRKRPSFVRTKAASKSGTTITSSEETETNNSNNNAPSNQKEISTTSETDSNNSSNSNSSM